MIRLLLHHRFVLYPIFTIALLFVLDKIFLIPEVRDRFIQPGGMFYYAHRKKQLSDLRAYLEKNDSKPVAVVFGDSRSFAIGDLTAQRGGHNAWRIFNFSGPQAVPGYHYFLAEKIFRGVHRPQYLILSVSPDNFNENSGVFASPVLNYGVDQPFIDENGEHISGEELEAYTVSRRYALMGMQFSLPELIRRSRGSLTLSLSGGQPEIPPELMPLAMGLFKGGKNEIPEEARAQAASLFSASIENLAHYSLNDSPRTLLLDRGSGASYSWFGTMGDQQLREETQRLRQIYLARFRRSENQFYYYRKTLELAKLAGVRVVVFQPQVNPYMREMLAENGMMELRSEIREIAEKHGAAHLDMNELPEARCSNFYDASHLSINCFPGITNLLLTALEKGP
jgi:hypothetical protein